MPQRANHEDRRAQIVYSVWAVIANEGIHGVTMRRVAAQAGVSVGRIQHYFASRDELVRVSARAMVLGAQARYETHGDGGDDPRAALRFAVGHVIPENDEQARGTTIWLAYVAASVNDEQIAAALAAAKRGQEEEVAQLLRRLGVATEQAVHDARSLIGLADGLAVRVLLGDLEAVEAVAALDAATERCCPKPSRRRVGSV